MFSLETKQSSRTAILGAKNEKKYAIWDLQNTFKFRITTPSLLTFLWLWTFWGIMAGILSSYQQRQDSRDRREAFKTWVCWNSWHRPPRMRKYFGKLQKNCWFFCTLSRVLTPIKNAGHLEGERGGIISDVGPERVQSIIFITFTGVKHKQMRERTSIIEALQIPRLKSLRLKSSSWATQAASLSHGNRQSFEFPTNSSEER